MRVRHRAAVALAMVLTLLVSCGPSGSDADLTIGTTDRVVSIDPAGSYDIGSTLVQTQVYQYLLNYSPGSSEVTPDAARSCDFTEPSVYTCTLKPDLTFANGHDLTASDVAFSFQRIRDIDDPNGPASLLTSMASVEATDELTVEFTLTIANDQTFPQVLVSSAGAIVDEQTYPADEVLSDAAAVDVNGFSGPYTISEYTKNTSAQFTENPDYNGAYGPAHMKVVALDYYDDSDELKNDVLDGAIDVAYRSLTPEHFAELEQADDDVTVHTGSGGELRYLVFNLNTMPGQTPEQKLAIRQAMASSIDRTKLSQEVYQGTYAPAWSLVPEGQIGANEAFKDLYGATPNLDAATKYLADAGVATPVQIDLRYNPDHYGSSSDAEYAAIKEQLEATGLFVVNLEATDWVEYAQSALTDGYPIFQLGWFPDYPDADNYLSPFLAPYSAGLPGNVTNNHYNEDGTVFADPEMSSLLSSQRTDPDPTTRAVTLGQIQTRMAEQVPYLPLLTGTAVAVAAKNVAGVDETLDSSFKFRFTSLSRS